MCLRRLGLLETPTEVVLGGGLLTARHPLLTSLLDAEFVVRAPRAELVPAGVPPIAGAALLGLERLGGRGERQGAPARPLRTCGHRMSPHPPQAGGDRLSPSRHGPAKHARATGRR